MNFVLKAMMRFPFSAPGRPGYEVRAWSEPGRFHTHWTYCAPLGFVKRHIERHGERGELEAFYQSWCLYDWPGADVLAGGKAGEHGHYRRLGLRHVLVGRLGRGERQRFATLKPLRDAATSPGTP